MTLAEIEVLSKQQKDLRLQIDETKNPTKIKELQKQRNKILHKIRKRAMKIAIEKHDSQAADVEEMKDSTKMFRAARLMR